MQGETDTKEKEAVALPPVTADGKIQLGPHTVNVMRITGEEENRDNDGNAISVTFYFDNSDSKQVCTPDEAAIIRGVRNKLGQPVPKRGAFKGSQVSTNELSAPVNANP